MSPKVHGWIPAQRGQQQHHSSPLRSKGQAAAARRGRGHTRGFKGAFSSPKSSLHTLVPTFRSPWQMLAQIQTLKMRIRADRSISSVAMERGVRVPGCRPTPAPGLPLPVGGHGLPGSNLSSRSLSPSVWPGAFILGPPLTQAHAGLGPDQRHHEEQQPRVRLSLEEPHDGRLTTGLLPLPQPGAGLAASCCSPHPLLGPGGAG